MSTLSQAKIAFQFFALSHSLMAMVLLAKEDLGLPTGKARIALDRHTYVGPTFISAYEIVGISNVADPELPPVRSHFGYTRVVRIPLKPMTFEDATFAITRDLVESRWFASVAGISRIHHVVLKDNLGNEVCVSRRMSTASGITWLDPLNEVAEFGSIIELEEHSKMLAMLAEDEYRSGDRVLAHDFDAAASRSNDLIRRWSHRVRLAA